MTRQSVLVQQAPGRPQQLVLLFHGYGANAEDLVPLGARLAAAFPKLRSPAGLRGSRRVRPLKPPFTSCTARKTR